MENIETIIKQIIGKHLGIAVDSIKMESTFIDDLEGDSLDTVEMILTIEDHFNIEIDSDAAESISTVQDVVNIIKNMLEA